MSIVEAFRVVQAFAKGDKFIDLEVLRKAAQITSYYVDSLEIHTSKTAREQAAADTNKFFEMEN